MRQLQNIFQCGCCWKMENMLENGDQSENHELLQLNWYQLQVKLVSATASRMPAQVAPAHTALLYELLLNLHMLVTWVDTCFKKILMLNVPLLLNIGCFVIKASYRCMHRVA